MSDEIYGIIGDDFIFVETAECHENKGATEDYSNRPYLIKSWESAEARSRAMQLTQTADVCVFGGYEALPYERIRMKNGLLSFDMGERMLKRGWLNLASPRILKMIVSYHLGKWHRKPLYKLCMSAFTASDQYKLKSFNDKCYKWGYFTKIDDFDVEISSDVSTSNRASLMWCSRYLMLKHPELPVLMAQRLKERGYNFHLSMYGDGEYRESTERLIKSLDLGDYITVHGSVPNDQVREAMRKSDIFLFTSDRYEGWGAVANESLSCGCVLVASDAIGSSPYLIKDGYNGFMYRSASTKSSFGNPDMQSLDGLTEKVMWLLNNRDKMLQMQKNAVENMQRLWSPRHAAESLLQLIDDLKNGKETSIEVGPCSKA